MNNIIAITLGPIYRTTSSVKKTKGLWASSYFFSYLAKHIIAPFKDRKFVLPIVSDPHLWIGDDGIGRFPDRFIFHPESGDFESLQTTINDVLKGIGAQLATFFTINRTNKSLPETKVDDIFLFLKNYLKIYAFEKECTKENIVEECNSLLDLMEMQDSYNLCETENYLTRFFEHDKLNSSFLVEDAFGKSDQKQLFKALDQISEQELKGLSLEEEEKKRRAYHNYIAIISADGDNMSNTIKKLLSNEKKEAIEGNPPKYKGESVQTLSKKLLDFGECISTLKFEDEKGEEDKEDKESWEYKARIIFLGGDDLLIFAPVMYLGKTVFDFVNAISNSFNNCVSELSEKPTISFGISITYVKFPMGEALEMAHGSLSKAKSHSSKNTVAFSLQKHSGQTNCGEIEKDKKIYELFLQLINCYKKEDDKIISSVIYWLGQNETILKSLLSLTENKNDRLINYFANSFNEPIHSDKKEFYKSLTNFLVEAKKSIEKPIDLLHSVLRFIHFIKIKRDE